MRGPARETGLENIDCLAPGARGPTQTAARLVLRAAARHGDVNLLSPAFRALVETVKTQMFPSCALPSDAEARVKFLRSKFADPSDL
jgi:hypothetical protein